MRWFVLCLSMGCAKPAVPPSPPTAGQVDHVGLTVTRLDASTRFFADVLGFEVRGGDEDYPSVFMNNGRVGLTLWQATEPEEAVPFDRKHNVGLHHLAISVASFEELDARYAAARDFPGVRIEFAPELSYGGPAKHMMLFEPSGNRIELIHRP